MHNIKRIFALIALAATGVMPVVSLAQTAPLMPPPQNACMDFSAVIKLNPGNDPADQVGLLNLQLALSKEGFNVDAAEFGHFGKSTRSAVAKFQEKYVSDILAPFGLTKGTGFPGTITRLKLQVLYGCRASASVPVPTSGIKLAITNLVLDSNGVSATFCNQGTSDLPTAPFRIRLNGINRDFEAIGAQKAGTCTTDTWKYETWGLSYDPGATFTAIGLIDPNNVYKIGSLAFPASQSQSASVKVPALPGAHLSVRSVILKSTGVQATFCNLGTVTLTSFPVNIVLNGVTKSFDIPEAYAAGKCQPKQWTYDTWGLTYTPGTVYSATVSVDPNNVIQETNEFDNVATVVGTP